MILDGANQILCVRYKPITTPAITWMQASDGYWRGRDRGASLDKYETELEFQGLSSELFPVYSDLKNKGATTLQAENDSEIYCFGREKFISKIAANDVAIVSMSDLTRVGLDLFSLKMRLRISRSNLNDSAGIITTELPTMYPISETVESSETTVNTMISSNSANITVAKHDTKAGYFEGMIRFYGWLDAGKFRYYLLTDINYHGRAKNFTINQNNFPMRGSNSQWLPFGPNTQVVNDIPRYTYAKCLEFEDLGPSSLVTWDFKIKFVQDRYVGV